MHVPGSTYSLYIHIPFCQKKCRYCDFYSVKYDEELGDAYCKALLKEWAMVKRRYELDEKRLTTIYIGGGTPTALSIKQLQAISYQLLGETPTTDMLEWTVECNPESFTDEKAVFLANAGVNRLTFGVQSMHDNELSFMGRVHSAHKVTEVLNSPALERFRSIGVDLIYGLPGQTLEMLEQSLRSVLQFPVVNHISIYELTISARTPFGRHQKLLPLPDEEIVCEMYERIGEVCQQFGFDRYEISNYARPGHRCRHNEVYWDHQPYVGIGCSSHSYVHPKRWANMENIREYVDTVEKSILPVEFIEDLDMSTLVREIIFLSLRRTDGIDELQFEKTTGMRFADDTRMEKLKTLVERGQIKKNDSKWTLTPSGMLLADAIARELMD